MEKNWSVQAIYDNPKYAPGSTEEPQTHAYSMVFDSQQEALYEYGERVKGGLPGGAKFADIYLWHREPRPQGRSHSVVKHCDIWADQKGVHKNEFIGAIQV